MKNVRWVKKLKQKKCWTKSSLNSAKYVSEIAKGNGTQASSH